MIEDYILRLDGLKNARSLSYLVNKNGKKIKDNLLIRSDKLSKITDETAHILKSKYNLCKVIDFRTENEISREPDYKIDGVSYIEIPVVPNDQIGITKKETNRSTFEEFVNKLQDEGIEKSNEFMINTYKSIISEYATKGYTKFFDELLTAEGAVLWHCSAGKDRAGYATLLVLFALGFDNDDIIRDYLYTNVCYRKTIDSCITEFGYEYTDVIECIFGVKREYLEVLIYEIMKIWGSMKNYLIEGVKLTQEKIELLQKKYLEV